MTREEAIEVLSQDLPCEHDTDLIEALKMAMDALAYDDVKYHEEHGEVIVDKAVWIDAERALSGDYAVGVDSTGRFVKASEVFCDRNICMANEYNGIGCDECEVTKSQESRDDLISKQVVIDTVHKTIYQFFDVCDDDEEVPMSDKDKLLLEVNKAICNNLKALEQSSGDAVSRQAILDYINRILNQGTGKKKSFKFIQKFVEKLQSAEKTEWIPVSERLPEKSDEFLVTVVDKEFKDYRFVGMAWFAHKKNYDIKESEWRELRIDETVIAWMPLPQPYKDGGE